MRRMLTLLAVLLCISCGPSEKKIKVPGIPFKLNDNITLYLPVDTTDKQRALIMKAARIHTERFESDWGSPVRPVRVSVINQDFIGCGDLKGVFSGCHYSPNGPIHVTSGSYYEIPALYHEYVHHMIPGNDSDHTDPRWESTWEPIGWSIGIELRAERFNLDISE